MLHRLRDQGNTVVVVEHDPTIIRAADHVIDLGPGAGERGGEVLFAGRSRPLAQARARSPPSTSPAGARIPLPAKRRRPHSRPRARRPRRVGEQPAGRRRRHPARVLRRASPASRARASRRLVDDVLYRGLRKRLGQPDGVPGRVPRDRGRGAHRRRHPRRPEPDRLDAARQRRDLPARLRRHPRLLRAHRRRRACAATRRRPSRSTSPAGAARPAPARASSRSRCSSSPTSTCPAPSATARASSPRCSRSRWQGRTIREVLDLTVAEALDGLRRRARGAPPAAAAGRRRPRLPARSASRCRRCRAARRSA